MKAGCWSEEREREREREPSCSSSSTAAAAESPAPESPLNLSREEAKQDDAYDGDDDEEMLV